MFTNLPDVPWGYFTTSSPGAITSSTKQRGGSMRVVPQTRRPSFPGTSLQTPR